MDYHFDEVEADKAVLFISQLNHWEGEHKGQPFILEEWERDIVRQVVGWKKEDGTRKYKTLFLAIPRKNGKSSLAAALALYFLLCDGENGAAIYGAAKTVEQAGRIYRLAKGFVRNSPLLRPLISKKKLAIREDLFTYGDNSYQVISAKSEGKLGSNPSTIIIALIIHEFHAAAHKNGLRSPV